MIANKLKESEEISDRDFEIFMQTAYARLDFLKKQREIEKRNNDVEGNGNLGFRCFPE